MAITLTKEMFQAVQPDPAADPDSGGTGTLAFQGLPNRKRKRMLELLNAHYAGPLSPEDEAEFTQFIPYLASMVRGMDDIDIASWVLDVPVQDDEEEEGEDDEDDEGEVWI